MPHQISYSSLLDWTTQSIRCCFDAGLMHSPGSCWVTFCYINSTHWLWQLTLKGLFKHTSRGWILLVPGIVATVIFLSGAPLQPHCTCRSLPQDPLYQVIIKCLCIATTPPGTLLCVLPPSSFREFLHDRFFVDILPSIDLAPGHCVLLASSCLGILFRKAKDLQFLTKSVWSVNTPSHTLLIIYE